MYGAKSFIARGGGWGLFCEVISACHRLGISFLDISERRRCLVFFAHDLPPDLLARRRRLDISAVFGYTII